jgi:hypothetical protein
LEGCQILNGVVQQAGATPLEKQAAARAVRCLRRINTDRFGRAQEIHDADIRLSSCLFHQDSTISCFTTSPSLRRFDMTLTPIHNCDRPLVHYDYPPGISDSTRRIAPSAAVRMTRLIRELRDRLRVHLRIVDVRHLKRCSATGEQVGGHGWICGTVKSFDGEITLCWKLLQINGFHVDR